MFTFRLHTNQNKPTSFSHILYPCHWSIKGGFPAKIDQLLFPLCSIDPIQASLPPQLAFSSGSGAREAKH